MKTPQFLRELMSSPTYMDKNSDAYAAVERYLKLLYPGTVGMDATGRMISPAYDMTYAQFYDAQMEFGPQIEKSKKDVASNDIEISEIIDVRVLMPWGAIEDKQLYIYDDNNNKPAAQDSNMKTVWRWHSEDGGNTCDGCASRDGEIYESKDDIPEIPVHPNCRCTITEDRIALDGRTLGSKAYAPKKKDEEMINKVLTKDLKEALKQHEGIKEHLYLDSNGILTIGIGNNVSKLANFIALNLFDAKDGHTLNNAEKENLYTQIMSDVDAERFSENNYRQYNVPMTEIESKFDQQLEQSYHELERKFPDFQTLPIPAQQALLDMQFNMGGTQFSNIKWPKLFNAVKNKDWVTAATEAHRIGIQDSRQDWTYNKFLQALQV